MILAIIQNWVKAYGDKKPELIRLDLVIKTPGFSSLLLTTDTGNITKNLWREMGIGYNFVYLCENLMHNTGSLPVASEWKLKMRKNFESTSVK